MVKRIAGADLALDSALAEAVDEEGWEPSDDVRERAHNALADAATCLQTLVPIHAERQFEIDIDGVRVGGFIDLIAHDQRGSPIIVDYKTGATPAEHYALQFALYAYAVRDEFPNSVARLLRIGAAGASFEPIISATDDQLRRAVVSASSMQTDEPRPGPQCTYCPYAYTVCSAAPK